MTVFLPVGEPMTAERGDVFHAVTFTAAITSLRRKRKTVDTVCGTRATRLSAADATVEGEPASMVLPWPPPVRAIRPATRCAECHRLTGRKSPASGWTDA